MVVIKRMKKLAAFALSLLMITGAVVAESAQEQRAESSAVQEDANVYKRLLRIEKQIKTVSANQKKIEAKNSEIKTELANLRVWIYRR